MCSIWRKIIQRQLLFCNCVATDVWNLISFPCVLVHEKCCSLLLDTATNLKSEVKTLQTEMSSVLTRISADSSLWSYQGNDQSVYYSQHHSYGHQKWGLLDICSITKWVTKNGLYPLMSDDSLLHKHWPSTFSKKTEDRVWQKTRHWKFFLLIYFWIS